MINAYENTASYYDTLFPIRVKELKFYKSYIRRKYRILDVGCGTGRITLALIQNTSKCSFDCIDISDHLLAIFKNKIEKLRQNYTFLDRIQIYKMDMANIQLAKKYHLIIFPFQSIQALTDLQKVQQCLTTVRNMLEKNGRIIITVNNPTNFDNALSAERFQGFFQYGEDNYILNTHYYNSITQNDFGLIQEVKQYNKKWYLLKRSVDEFQIIKVGYEDFNHICDTIQLTIENAYSSYDRHKYQKDDEEIILVLKATDSQQ